MEDETDEGVSTIPEVTVEGSAGYETDAPVGAENEEGVYTIPEVTVEGDPVGEDAGAPPPDLDFDFPGATLDQYGHVAEGVGDAIVEGAETVGNRIFVPTRELEREMNHTPDDA